MHRLRPSHNPWGACPVPSRPVAPAASSSWGEGENLSDTQSEVRRSSVCALWRCPFLEYQWVCVVRRCMGPSTQGGWPMRESSSSAQPYFVLPSSWPESRLRAPRDPPRFVPHRSCTAEDDL